MSSASFQRGGITFQVNRFLFLQDGGNGFECHTEVNVLTIAQSTLYATTVVGGSTDMFTIVDKEVVLLTATTADPCKTFTIFEALYCINAYPIQSIQ